MTLSIKNTSIILSFILIPGTLFAAGIETYEDYQKRVTSECENKPWTNSAQGGGNIIAIPKYPKLEKAAIEKAITDTENTKTSAEELERIRASITNIQNASADKFKTLETSRIMYQAAMNGVFGCAVIQSRQSMRMNLLNKIKKEYPSNHSEIEEKLKREGEKLAAQSESLSCIQISGKGDTPSNQRVVNAAIYQYCHYNTYLLYIRDNLNKDNAAMLELDASIGKIAGETSTLTQNSTEWAREISGRDDAIGREIIKVNQVLPRAIEAFREMERTYSLHLMLIIIYDDYLRLRDNLYTYFNAVSQLLEKTQNAQIPNN